MEYEGGGGGSRGRPGFYEFMCWGPCEVKGERRCSREIFINHIIVDTQIWAGLWGYNRSISLDV